MKQKVVGKYTFRPAAGHPVVFIGNIEKFLKATIEDGVIELWAEKGTAKMDGKILRPPYPSEYREFAVQAVRTGWVYDAEEIGEYLDTVKDTTGEWHIFYKKLE